MEDNETKSEAQRAILRFMDPEVNYQVMLASTPEAAKLIIESLPGVREMASLGPEAGTAALDLLQQEDTLDNYRLSGVALYILLSYPSPEVKRVLAGYILSGRFRGINSQLAAEVFLRSAGIEVRTEESISTALREAKKIESTSSTK